MTHERCQYVQGVMDSLKPPDGTKGMVSDAEYDVLCSHITELRADPVNVARPEDWQRLTEYWRLARKFTRAEADRIYFLYGQFKYPKVRA